MKRRKDELSGFFLNEMDITQALRGWSFEPGQVNVRLIRGNDGKPKLQLRLDLGLLQMELDGRPDGKRPHRAPTELAFHKKHGRQATLAAVRAPSRFGEMVIDELKLVSNFQEKPDAAAGRINGGFFILKRGGLEKYRGIAFIGLDDIPALGLGRIQPEGCVFRSRVSRFGGRHQSGSPSRRDEEDRQSNRLG